MSRRVTASSTITLTILLHSKTPLQQPSCLTLVCKCTPILFMSTVLSSALSRLSTLGITNDYVDMALGLLSAASSYVNSTGYLTQVVNPLDFSEQGEESPEGQSFLVMAYAAHKDWNNAGRAGHTNNDGLGSKSGALPQTGGLGSAVVIATGIFAILVTL